MRSPRSSVVAWPRRVDSALIAASVRSADELEEIDDLELDDWLNHSFDSDEASRVAPVLKDVHKRRQRISAGEDDEA